MTDHQNVNSISDHTYQERQKVEIGLLTYVSGAAGTADSSTVSAHSMQLRSRGPIVSSSEIELTPGNLLSFPAQKELLSLKNRFDGKEFMSYQAKELPHQVLENASVKEQDYFLKTCVKVHVSIILMSANEISSHVIYIIKNFDSGQLICKARNATHGNKDLEKQTLKTRLFVVLANWNSHACVAGHNAGL